MTEATVQPAPQPAPASPLESGALAKWFWAVVAGMFLMNTTLGLLVVPNNPALLIGFGVLSGAITLAAPLSGLFLAASGEWTWRRALTWFAAGAGLHAGAFLASRAIEEGGLLLVLIQAGAQAGLLVWAAGLGACVALVIKDKNILLPVCIFLAGFDTWLIMNPYVFTSQLVANNSQVFQEVAMKVPAARPEPAPEAKPEQRAPRITPLAYIGPADLIFCMAFFVVLFRFRMQVKRTLYWLVPVLVVYLLMVFGLQIGMLPALVPIGATVLLVNLREFKMTRDEKLGTWLISAISLAFAITGIYLRATYVPPKPQPARGTLEYAPDAPGPEGSPQPALPGRSQL